MAFFKPTKKKINNKWYPQAVTIGRPIEMEEVAARIAEMSTASEADSKAVLTALGKVLGNMMNQGRTVHLEGLGHFYLSCISSGNGKDTAKEVTADCITATRVRFMPERRVSVEGTVTRSLVGKDVFWVNINDVAGISDADSSVPGGGEDVDGGGDDGEL